MKWLGHAPTPASLAANRKNCGFLGSARTFRWMEADHIPENDPYGIELEAVDSLRPGDAVVHSMGTNTSWGELMSTVAKETAPWEACETARFATATG